MAAFWEDDEIVAPAPMAPAAPASPTVPADIAAPASPAMAASPGQAALAPSPMAAAPAPAAARPFWEQDEVIAPAPPPRPASADRSLMGEVGHQLGLTARAAVQGVAALPGMVSDAATGVVNAGLDAYDAVRPSTMSELVTGKEPGFRFQKVSSALGNIMDQAGVSKPENATERVVQDMTTGVGSAATGIGAGQVMAKAAGPISKALGTMLAAAPGTQLTSAAAGTGAAGVTRESGGGEISQALAGVAGSLAPSGAAFATQAGLRGALRGGEVGRQRVADNIQTFQDAAGTTPTVGQATQSRALQGLETGLSNVIGGSGIMVRRGEAQAKSLQESVEKLASSLAPNASGVDAGEAISRGVNTYRDNVRVTQQRLYSALDRFVAADAPTTVGNTRATLQELNAGIDGAENLSSWFRNGKLNDLEKSLVADLEKAAAAQAPTGWRSSLMNAPAPSLDTATLPYQSIQKLRTLVGREMTEANFNPDISRDKLSKLYAALSEDLGRTVKAAGPQAEQAWTRANAYTRLVSERMSQISSIVNKDAPEHVFRAATSGLSEGGTQIRRLMKSMPVENRREVAAAVLQRLGRARGAQQNESGDAFSSETFLTNLANMSQPARKALFNTSGFPGLEQRIETMGRMAANRREGSKVFANPSGTARMFGLGAWSLNLGRAIYMGDAAGIAQSLAIPASAAGAAKLATSSKLVNFLGRETSLSPAATSAGLAAMTRLPNGEERKGPITDRGRPFQNRLMAGRVAREADGYVLPHPMGGFLVHRRPGQ